jgi:hypothetical protein
MEPNFENEQEVAGSRFCVRHVISRTVCPERTGGNACRVAKKLGCVVRA